jgi:hypothetical protein
MEPLCRSSKVDPPVPVIATPFDELAAIDTCRGVRLESCSELDRIVVNTRNSTYEMILLSDAHGEVMVRGGAYFEEFRRAVVVGSILGGTGVNLGAICVGFHLELLVDGRSIVTSRVDAVYCERVRNYPPGTGNTSQSRCPLPIVPTGSARRDDAGRPVKVPTRR